jgi:hypothetical protein
MYGQRMQVIKEFIYLQVKLEISGEWRQKESVKVNGKNH